MSARFEIGEVATLVRLENADVPGKTDQRYFGTDVTVDSAPIRSWSYVGEIGYWVVAHDGRRFDVGAVCLRRKPGKQDWIRLCRLDEVRAPREELI